MIEISENRDLAFHKGQPCILNSGRLCQEGYCSECWLWVNRQPVKLSPREHQIAIMVAQGLRNKEIAFRLGICESTVKNYVYSAFIKLGCRNRIQLALLYACELNLGAGI
jgi:DNA-binding NarL/FixJ family response regulator